MIKVDWKNIDEYLADPIKYRFIDSAIVEEKEAWGEKFLSSQDWYYIIHFPDNPIMPGVFVMESIMQTGVLIVTQSKEITNPLMYLNGCNKMRMYGEVRPGNILKTHVVLNSFRYGIAQYEGCAFVDEKKVCEMKFTLVHPDEIKKFSERLGE